jgi:GT2 family glycosyltransferase
MGAGLSKDDEAGAVDGIPLIQYWHDEQVPTSIVEIFASFRDLNPAMRHLVFNETSAEEFIAEHFGDREVAAFRACAVPSMQSDYIRFCAVLALGGIYSDVDFRCAGDLSHLVPAVGRGRIFRGPRGNIASSIFAFGSPGHPFLKLALEIATANIERRFPDVYYFSTGPPIFSALVYLHQHGSLDGAAGKIDEQQRPALHVYAETIEAHPELVDALDGVEVSPDNGYPDCLRHEGDLPYKSTDLHWPNFKGEIFRSPERAVPDAAALAAEIRERLGPVPERSEWPLVSIVVLNRDGVDHLRRLLQGLVEHTDYPELELVVVDNASSDDSLELLRTVEAPFPISILANAHNESFADACNQGAEVASGELLLFLNNDAEPFEPGWLRELVTCLEDSGAGAAGPTLLEPSREPSASHGYAVHQRGLWLRERDGALAPGYRDRLADPLGDVLGEDMDPVALVAACLLIRRRVFGWVEGFTRGYWYGPEDVDLALKLRDRGMPPVCSGRSILIHPPGSTLKAIDSEQRGAWVRGNRRLFMERWGPRVRRELELDRLRGGGLWVDPDDLGAGGEGLPGRAEWEALGFCLASSAPGVGEADALLERLGEELHELGHRCLMLRGGEVESPAGLEYDIAVHLRGRGRYALKPGQLNVLWAVERLDALTALECSDYDLIVSCGRDLIQRLGREGIAPQGLAILDGEEPGALAEGLLIAVEARAMETGFPTRIGDEAVAVPW